MQYHGQKYKKLFESYFTARICSLNAGISKKAEILVELISLKSMSTKFQGNLSKKKLSKLNTQENLATPFFPLGIKFRKMLKYVSN